MKTNFLIAFIVLTMLSACGIAPKKSDNLAKTAQLYEHFVRQTPVNQAQLQLFFNKMPKGGDLHHHYSGSIYAETYLDWVQAAGYWINQKSLKIENKKSADSITVDTLRKNNTLYRQLLTLWSDHDYNNHFHLQPPPDSNFFNTFGYFGKISTFDYQQGLNILKQRALKENICYIETMLTSVGYAKADANFDKNSRAANDERLIQLFNQYSQVLEADQLLAEKVSKLVNLVEKSHLEIDGDSFLMRYQTYASRNSAPSKVFSSLYAAFKAAKQSKYLVGVNIVGPENGIVAIADYTLHMKMFEFLKNKFPSVHRALHAGELTLGMVRPKNLLFHIAQAVDIAGAERIGHGIDLPYENNPFTLLNKIKQRDAAVEINLSSNEFILGVKGQAHPYLIYSANQVPMVISTDDSGVSRNNLTGEYVLLASRYKPTYPQIKQYVYNSIKYSFLTKTEKNALIKKLNQSFNVFEQEMADYSSAALLNKD